jgi:hypothetical protein
MILMELLNTLLFVIMCLALISVHLYARKKDLEFELKERDREITRLQNILNESFETELDD